MRVFVAGATGTMGRPLVRALAARGHEVVGMTRTPSKRQLIAADGGQAVVADALDPRAVNDVIAAAAPTHVVHLLTALPPVAAMRPGDLRPTNRLRLEGTRHLLAASIRAGVRRIVAESFLAVYGSGREGLVDESDPLEDPGPPPLRETIAALRGLEQQVLSAARRGDIEGVVLRFGAIYGPGVPSTEAALRQLQSRRFFVPAGASGRMPFVHIDDVVSAMVAALERPVAHGAYNIADDDPMPFAAFAGTAAVLLGVPAPRTVPAWLVRMAAPLGGALTSLNLALSSERAHRELGWAPRYRTPHDGLLQTVAALRRAA